jgi:hypothetical protein
MTAAFTRNNFLFAGFDLAVGMPIVGFTSYNVPAGSGSSEVAK